MSSIVIIRATSDHMGYIISSWLKSYRDGLFTHIDGAPSTVTLPIPDKSAFYSEHQKLIKSHAHLCWVAVNAEDHSQIFGWVCGSPSCIHFIYVKGAFRRMGIGKILWEHIGQPIIFTHASKHYRKFLRLGIKFNPYLFKE